MERGWRPPGMTTLEAQRAAPASRGRVGGTGVAGGSTPDAQADYAKPKKVWAVLCGAESGPGAPAGPAPSAGCAANRNKDVGAAAALAATVVGRAPATATIPAPPPSLQAPQPPPPPPPPPLPRDRKRTTCVDPEGAGAVATDAVAASSPASMGDPLPQRASKARRGPSSAAVASSLGVSVLHAGVQVAGESSKACAGTSATKMPEARTGEGVAAMADEEAKKPRKTGHKKCEHGRQKRHCRECPDGGTSLCEHKRQKNKCKDCGGASICHHSRNRSECIQCRGGKICSHGRRKSECRQCGGSQICQHDRKKSQCKECGGSAICQHNRRKTICKECARPRQGLQKLAPVAPAVTGET